MSRKVLVTPRTFGKVDPAPLSMLREADCEIISNPYGRVMSEEEMSQLVADVDGVIVGLDPLSEKVLRRADRLKAISKYGVGVNNIDIEYASGRGILITNTPGANSAAVAELTLGLLLATCRRICTSDRDIRQGSWKQYPGVQLEGKVIGIIGTGQIGKQVAERARGLRMTVICHDICPDYQWAASAGASYAALSDLISRSDFLSVHVPLTDDTYHLISADELALMKSSVVIVNTSRGGIVDEDALYDALRGNRIAGAALDVFEDEPPADSPLLELENVVLTSHVGAHTREAVETMGRMAAANLVKCLDGLVPDTTVNRTSIGLGDRVWSRGGGESNASAC